MKKTFIIPALLIASHLCAQYAYEPGSAEIAQNDLETAKITLSSDSGSSEMSEEEDDFVPGKVILSLMGGTCMPFGKFAAITPSNSSTVAMGFADPGGVYNFNFMVVLAKRFGTTVSLSYFDNPVNINRFANYVEPQLELNTSNNYSYTFNTGSWRTNTFMLGLAYRSMGENVSFELHFKFGLMSTRTPDILITQIDGNGNSVKYFEHVSEQHFSLGTTPGVQFRFRVFKSLFVNMNSELSFAQFGLNHRINPDKDDPFGFGNQIIMANFNLQGGLSWEFEQ